VAGSGVVAVAVVATESAMARAVVPTAAPRTSRFKVTSV
jgi:hypothetical protein